MHGGVSMENGGWSKLRVDVKVLWRYELQYWHNNYIYAMMLKLKLKKNLPSKVMFVNGDAPWVKIAYSSRPYYVFYTKPFRLAIHNHNKWSFMCFAIFIQLNKPKHLVFFHSKTNVYKHGYK